MLISNAQSALQALKTLTAAAQASEPITPTIGFSSAAPRDSVSISAQSSALFDALISSALSNVSTYSAQPVRGDANVRKADEQDEASTNVQSAAYTVPLSELATPSQTDTGISGRTTVQSTTTNTPSASPRQPELAASPSPQPAPKASVEPAPQPAQPSETTPATSSPAPSQPASSNPTPGQATSTAPAPASPQPAPEAQASAQPAASSAAPTTSQPASSGPASTGTKPSTASPAQPASSGSSQTASPTPSSSSKDNTSNSPAKQEQPASSSNNQAANQAYQNGNKADQPKPGRFFGWF